MNFFNQKYRRLMGRLLRFNIKVMDAAQTVEAIIQNNVSVIRLGDGEFDIIRGESIPYQNYNQRLSKDLKNIALKGSENDLLVCLPDVFFAMNRYTKESRSFFYDQFFYQNRKILRKISKTNNIYGSTFLSRPYIDLEDKSKSGLYFKQLKNIWNDKNILIVEGNLTRSGEGNDLYKNANQVKRIICPSKNAFRYIRDIEASIKKYEKNSLVLLMLGPTAKIIVNDLRNEGIQLIDLGHIDTEYEWFKMKAKTKVKIPYKHTAEFNEDKDIKLRSNIQFENEIVDVIKSNGEE